ncbi:MAG: large-conductance mechanosensitive channel protein MscL [Gemmataceae bacterium]|jgi:large conductance mechanosensitive channel
MGVIQEFKKFALRGNVIDMAVGIIIGAAFTTVVKSLVDDIIMPPIGMMTGNISFKDQGYQLGIGADGNPIMLKYGAFINNVFTFLIVAWAVFMLVKAINLAEHRLRFGEQPPEDAPPPPEEVLLLRDIRDSLKRA